MSIKNIMIFTGGIGVGSLAGYIFCKKTLEDKYRMDVEDNRQYYLEKLEELGVMEEGFEAETMDEDEEEEYDEEDEEEQEDDSPEQALIREYKGTPKLNYSKPSLDELKRAIKAGVKNVPFPTATGVSAVVLSNGEESLGEVDEDDEETEYVPSDDPEYEAELEARAEEYAKRRSENMKSGEPYLIEPEEYVDCPEDYDRQALYYYAKDRTLCEDDDQEVEEEEACVGLDYEDVLGMQTTCWVRNDRLRVLYEIHRINDSYKAAVLNARETPREREFRIQSRRKQALDDR